MSNYPGPPSVAVVHLTTVENHDGEPTFGEKYVIPLDHQANQEVCEAVQRMFDRENPTATREDQDR